MDTIQNFDHILFLLINHVPHVWWSDLLAQLLSGFGNAWILWAVIGAVLFIREEQKDHWFILSCGIVGILTSISEFVLKYVVGRGRPDSLPGVIVIPPIPNSFSFPSTHALFAFACAYLFSEKEPKWRIGLFILACAVCLSRVYLGHHYPLDVFCGAGLGYGIGIFSVSVRQYMRRSHKHV